MKRKLTSLGNISSGFTLIEIMIIMSMFLFSVLGAALFHGFGFKFSGYLGAIIGFFFIPLVAGVFGGLQYFIKKRKKRNANRSNLQRKQLP